VAAFPRQDIQDAICVPLRTGDEVLGVINVSNRWNVHPFTPADLEFMQALAHQAVVSIRNAHSFEELERQRYTVERLLHELGRAQQAERARVAREIHDGPAQTFFAGLRNAQAVRALLAAGGEAREVASELEVILRQGIAEIRAVMIDLQPPSLDTEPLSAALDTYVRRFEQRTGIDTQLSCHSEREDLPTAVETCLYRIAQEALVNVSKHAEAQHCWVTLEVQERSCFLEVRDDGKGFDLSAADAEATEHLGMSLLNERAMLAGGRLVVETTPGKGTAVTVSVPLLGVAETGSGRTP
jgi:signal transduction histidine kinase